MATAAVASTTLRQRKSKSSAHGWLQKHDATLLRTSLGVEPDRADDSQYQVDEEEQGQCQTAVHLLRAPIVEFQLLQIIFEGLESADAIKRRSAAAYQFLSVLLNEALGITPPSVG